MLSTTMRIASPFVVGISLGLPSCRKAVVAKAAAPSLPPSIEGLQSRRVGEMAMSLFSSAAMTDRGQMKSAKARNQKIIATVEALEAMITDMNFEVQADDFTDLYGTWELVWSNVELFRSSPFFQSLNAVMPNQDAAEFFFFAHALQTGLVSKIGKIEQVIMPRALPQEVLTTSGVFQIELYSKVELFVLGDMTIPLVGFGRLSDGVKGTVGTTAWGSAEAGLEKRPSVLMRLSSVATEIKDSNLIPQELEQYARLPVGRLFESILQGRPSRESSDGGQILNEIEFNTTYVDQNFRITRSANGEIFLFSKTAD